MNASTAQRILAQCPAPYPVFARVGDRVHEIIALEYSHDPAAVTLTTAPGERPDIGDRLSVIIADLVELREFSPRDKNLEDVHQMLKGGLTCWMKHLAAQDAAEKAVAQGLVPSIAAPEPEATIEELNKPVAGETFGEAYVAPETKETTS